jgi:hypothetical protein
MRDPVVTCDGHSFEREAIGSWLATNDTSPLTGAVLRSKVLVPNHALRTSIVEFIDKRAAMAIAAPPPQDTSALTVNNSLLRRALAAHGVVAQLTGGGGPAAAPPRQAAEAAEAEAAASLGAVGTWLVDRARLRPGPAATYEANFARAGFDTLEFLADAELSRRRLHETFDIAEGHVNAVLRAIGQLPRADDTAPANAAAATAAAAVPDEVRLHGSYD